MKRIISALCALVLTAALPVAASAQELVLGGQPVGIELQTDGVVVAGFAEVETETGICSPAKEAGLREGDRIVQIGDTPVTAAEDLVRAVGELQGETAEITVRRGETSQTLPVQSVRSADGQWMLGLWLRDESSGIGTLTFYDPSSGRYGALGHGVTDETSGETLPIRGGRITEAQIVSVTPGSPGTPGELTGCAERSSALGSIEKNCEKGIYGEAGAVLGEGSAEVGTPTPGPARCWCPCAIPPEKDSMTSSWRITARASASAICWPKPGLRRRIWRRSFPFFPPRLSPGFLRQAVYAWLIHIHEEDAHASTAKPPRPETERDLIFIHGRAAAQSRPAAPEF